MRFFPLAFALAVAVVDGSVKCNVDAVWKFVMPCDAATAVSALLTGRFMRRNHF